MKHNHVALKSATGEGILGAQSWVSVNVTLDNKPVSNALEQVYASGYAFGDQDATNDLRGTVGFNWDEWTPGNSAQALMVDTPGGLRSLLNNSEVTIRGMDSVSLDRIGRALAEGLASGQGARGSVEGIREALTDQELRNLEKGLIDLVSAVVDDPARAMTIARTETARALVQGNLERYKDAGVTQIEWITADPCPICEEFEGMIVPMGDEFGDGVTEPPAHPNCVCDVLPVIEDLPAVNDENFSDV